MKPISPLWGGRTSWTNSPQPPIHRPRTKECSPASSGAIEIEKQKATVSLWVKQKEDLAKLVNN